MKNNKKTITISIDKILDINMEKDNVNKSKLINYLIKEYLSNNKFDNNIFKKK